MEILAVIEKERMFRKLFKEREQKIGLSLPCVDDDTLRDLIISGLYPTQIINQIVEDFFDEMMDDE